MSHSSLLLFFYSRNTENHSTLLNVKKLIFQHFQNHLKTLRKVENQLGWSDFETGMRKNDILYSKLSYIIRFIDINIVYF